MRKIYLLIILAIILIACFVFISDKYMSSEGPELERVTVMVPFIPQAQWSAFYTAIDKGYYREEGLDIEMQYSTKGSAGPLEQLIGGQVDFVLTDRDSIIMARSSGLDVVTVYLIEPTNVFYIISEKGKNITAPTDLAGKKVGVISPASGTYHNLFAILSLSGMSIDDLEVIQAGTAITSAFLEGEFDAAVVHLSQRLLIEEQKTDLNIIKASDYSDISTGHIAVKSDLIQENPELIKRFLRATEKGIAYATNNSEEAVEIYIRFNPDAEPKREVSQKLWNAFVEEFKYKGGISGLDSYEAWQENQEVLLDTGLIEKETDVSEMFTNDFIPQ